MEAIIPPERQNTRLLHGAERHNKTIKLDVLPSTPSVRNIYRSTRDVRAETCIVLHVNF